MQGRFKMIRSGNRLESPSYDNAEKIIKFCFMLHNMIVKMAGAGQELDAGGVALSHHGVVHEFGLTKSWTGLNAANAAAWYGAAAAAATDTAERRRLTGALARYRHSIAPA